MSVSVIHSAKPAPLYTSTSQASLTARRIPFPNGTAERPHFPPDSPELRLATLLWEAGIIDENCLSQSKITPTIDSRRMQVIDQFLQKPIRITDRDGKITILEKTTIFDLLTLFGAEESKLVGSIVPYLLGVDFFLALLRDLGVSIAPDSPILPFLQNEFATFPIDIDLRLHVSKMREQPFQHVVDLLARESGKDAEWLKQFCFTKKKHVYEQHVKHFFLFGLRAEFIEQEDTAAHPLDCSYVEKIELPYLFISDAMQFNTSHASKQILPVQACLDRMLKVARIDHELDNYDEFTWPMLQVKRNKGYHFLPMKKDERIEETEFALFDKVIKSAPYPEARITHFADIMKGKWKSHFDERVCSLFKFTHDLCSTITQHRLASEQDITQVWKEMTRETSFSEEMDPFFGLMHILITKLNLAFTAACQLIKTKEQCVAKVAKSVPKILFEEKESEKRAALLSFFAKLFGLPPLACFHNDSEQAIFFKWLTGLLSSKAHIPTAKTIWKQTSAQVIEGDKENCLLASACLFVTHDAHFALTIVDELTPEKRLSFVNDLPSDLMAVECSRVVRITAQAVEQIAVKTAFPNICRLIFLLCDTGQFTRAAELTNQLLEQGIISTDNLKLNWESVCRKALAHPQGGKLPAILLWEIGYRAGICKLQASQSLVQLLFDNIDLTHFGSNPIAVKASCLVTSFKIDQAIKRAAAAEAQELLETSRGKLLTDEARSLFAEQIVELRIKSEQEIDAALTLLPNCRNSLIWKNCLAVVAKSGSQAFQYKGYCVWKEAYAQSEAAASTSMSSALLCLARSGHAEIQNWLSKQQALQNEECKLILLATRVRTCTINQAEELIGLLQAEKIQTFYTPTEIASLWCVLFCTILETEISALDDIRRAINGVIHYLNAIQHAPFEQKQKVIDLLAAQIAALAVVHNDLSEFRAFYADFTQKIHDLFYKKPFKLEFTTSIDECGNEICHFQPKTAYTGFTKQDFNALSSSVVLPLVKMVETGKGHMIAYALYGYLSLLNSSPFKSLVGSIFNKLVYFLAPEEHERYHILTRKLAAFEEALSERNDNETRFTHTLYLTMHFSEASSAPLQFNAFLKVIEKLLSFKTGYALWRAVTTLGTCQHALTPRVLQKAYECIFSQVELLPYYAISIRHFPELSQKLENALWWSGITSLKTNVPKDAYLVATSMKMPLFVQLLHLLTKLQEQNRSAAPFIVHFACRYIELLFKIEARIDEVVNALRFAKEVGIYSVNPAAMLLALEKTKELIDNETSVLIISTIVVECFLHDDNALDNPAPHRTLLAWYKERVKSATPPSRSGCTIQ